MDSSIPNRRPGADATETTEPNSQSTCARLTRQIQLGTLTVRRRCIRATMWADVTTPLRNTLVGLVVAVAIALMLIPSIGGIASWKILLALFGLALWFLAEKRR